MQLLKKIKENLQFVAVGIIALCWILLVFAKEPAIHIVVDTVFFPIVLAIELYLIFWLKQATITHWYIPKLPKKIDWPIAVITPIVFVGKALLMWTNKETITVWWAAGAIIENWIISHLCSFEREQK